VKLLNERATFRDLWSESSAFMSIEDVKKLYCCFFTILKIIKLRSIRMKTRNTSRKKPYQSRKAKRKALSIQERQKLVAIYLGFWNYLKDHHVFKDFDEEIEKIVTAKQLGKKKCPSLFSIFNKDEQADKFQKEFISACENARNKFQLGREMTNLYEKSKKGLPHHPVYYIGYYLNFYLMLSMLSICNPEDKLMDDLGIVDKSFMQSKTFQEHLNIGIDQAKRAEQALKEMKGIQFNQEKALDPEKNVEDDPSSASEKEDSYEQEEIIIDLSAETAEKKKMEESSDTESDHGEENEKERDHSGPSALKDQSSQCSGSLGSVSSHVKYSIFAKVPTSPQDEMDMDESKLLESGNYAEIKSRIDRHLIKDPEKLENLIAAELKDVKETLCTEKADSRNHQSFYYQTRGNKRTYTEAFDSPDMQEAINVFSESKCFILELKYRVNALQNLLHALDRYYPMLKY